MLRFCFVQCASVFLSHMFRFWLTVVDPWLLMSDEANTTGAVTWHLTVSDKINGLDRFFRFFFHAVCHHYIQDIGQLDVMVKQ